MSILTSDIADRLIEEQGFDLVIPAQFTAISDEAFFAKKLKSVELPGSVIFIGAYAFSDNQLTSVDLPDGLEAIGEDAFSYNQLKSINLPDSVVSIGAYAFSDNQLASVDLPDGLEAIGEGAFSYNQLKSIDLPDSVVSIGDYVFSGNQLTSLNLPDGVETVGKDLFLVSRPWDDHTLEDFDFTLDEEYAFDEIDLMPADYNWDHVIAHAPTPEIIERSLGMVIPRTQKDKFSTIKSIDHIETCEQISRFSLKKSVLVDGKRLSEVMVGTTGKDKIIGTSGNEILVGSEGGDVLRGGGGSDGFLFQNSDGFGKKAAIKIKDFSSADGDAVLVDKDIIDFGKKLKIKIVLGKKTAFKWARKSNKDIVFNLKKGFLYFNENGKEKGWGDGGLFAKLQGAPELGADDFTIV